jgi:hypothetical protein
MRIRCRLHVKTNSQFPLLLRFLYTAENGPFESYGRPRSTLWQSHCSLVSVLSSQVPQCATVYVEHVKGKDWQPYVVEY